MEYDGMLHARLLSSLVINCTKSQKVSNTLLLHGKDTSSSFLCFWSSFYAAAASSVLLRLLLRPQQIFFALVFLQNYTEVERKATSDERWGEDMALF